MANHLIKNIDFSTVLEMTSLVDYREGQVVSRTLSQGKASSMTLFAFDQGEEISSHSSSGDALVYVLDGTSKITIGDEVFEVKKGETIVMPAGIPHALEAIEQFKMMLVVIFKQD
jgi:quercetin dioxygenase-like cupin family protein